MNSPKATYHISWPDSKSSTKVLIFDAMASAPPKELSLYDKGRIEGRSKSMTDGEIAHDLHIPRRTVSNFRTRLRIHQTTENLPRPGRPRIMTASQDKRIMSAAEANTDAGYNLLKNLSFIERDLWRTYTTS